MGTLKMTPLVKKNPLNDPEQWTDSREPPWFDVKHFQKRIDRAIGKNKDGHSIIKLIWAPTVWTRYFGESMPEYWYARYRSKTGWKYKLVPRWLFVERIEPARYVDAWEATRYIHEDGRVGDRGPAPQEMFTLKSVCATHTELKNDKGEPYCCAAWETKENNYLRCWGEYREPNDQDLGAIIEAFKTMEANPFFDKYSPISSEELDFIAKQARHEHRTAMQAKDDRWWEIFMDQVNFWGYRVNNDDPGVAHHGNKHFPHMEQNESGIWAPRAELKDKVKETNAS